MTLTRLFASAIIAASVGLVAAEAQTLRDINTPAETPPESYTAKQYVDSRGCVFIRAGIDGVVNWVPRVTRDREVLCGYEPTFAKSGEPEPDESRTAQAEEITPPTDPEPSETATDKPEPPAPKAKPVARPVEVEPKPAKDAKEKPKRRAAAAPAPRPAKPAAPAPETKPAPAPASTEKSRRVTRSAEATDCPGVTGISRYYTGVDRGRGVIRCGPQQADDVKGKEVTVIRGGQPVTVKKRVATGSQSDVAAESSNEKSPARRVDAATLPPGTRIVPRHVYNQQQAARIKGQKIPDGYREAWDDDRLNPKRAHQTIDGAMKSGLAWTNTVPRKLYERDSGRVVTHLYPGLIYPYHSYEEMQAAGYSISSKGKPKDDRATTRKVVVRKKDETGAHVSSKTAPRKATATQGGGKYVQVGTFGNPANAQRSATQLQSMGLPVRIGKYTRGGREYRIVMAGPLAQDQVGGALAKARRAGFGDAFVRK